MRRSAAAVLAAGSLFPPPAHAWWATGHLAVAEVAARRLTLNASAAVAHLLSLDAAAYPYESALPDAADWLDLIKSSTDVYSAWHYADAPLAGGGPGRAVAPAPAWTDAASQALVRDFVGAPNVVGALSRAFRALAPGSGADAPTRALMLRATLHLVGDLHQPCHTAALQLPAAGGALDAGANAEALHPPAALGGGASASNLHAFWDAMGGDAASVGSTFPAQPPGSAGVPSAPLRAYVDALEADRAVAPPPPTLPTFSVAALTARDGALVRAWHAEGVALAASAVYLPQPVADALAAAAAARSAVAVNTSHPSWPVYAASVRTLARQRVMLAGVRLAAALNALLPEAPPRAAPPPAPPPSPPLPGIKAACADFVEPVVASKRFYRWAAIIGWAAAALAVRRDAIAAWQRQRQGAAAAQQGVPEDSEEERRERERDRAWQQREVELRRGDAFRRDAAAGDEREGLVPAASRAGV